MIPDLDRASIALQRVGLVNVPLVKSVARVVVAQRPLLLAARMSSRSDVPMLGSALPIPMIVTANAQVNTSVLTSPVLPLLQRFVHIQPIFH